ncbi:MAG: methyltransferase domain-containing protein [Pseudorhodobacter sp.]
MQMPRLVDRPALDRQRRRACAMAEPALFLQEAVADEIEERLTEVNRTFTDAAVVTGFPDLWRARLPDARIVADRDLLDLGDATQDLVIHALCLHWADDPVGQLVQCRRALRPDGMLLAVLFGGATLHELRAVLAEAEVVLTGGLSPRVLPMAEIRDLGGLLQRAGFALPVADSQSRDVHYRDILHLMRDLRAMGEGNALASRSRRSLSRALIADAQMRYAAAFPAGPDRLRARFEMIFLTGWAPAPGQQQPLRPGTATQRLADALRTDPDAPPATKSEG